VARSLKVQNQLRLAAILAANLAAFFTAVHSDALVGSNWNDLVGGVNDAFPAGLGIALLGVINSQLSPEAKARIIFFRWTNPLPGSEAFSKHAKADQRIDLSSLQKQYGPLPRSGAEQNKLWYRLYKTVESEPSVQDAHRDYLFARDYACLSLMMIPLLGVLGFSQIKSPGTAVVYLVLLIVQLVLAWRAARNNGIRFVKNVLAVKAAGH
jgi:hypothetical protein